MNGKRPATWAELALAILIAAVLVAGLFIGAQVNGLIMALIF